MKKVFALVLALAMIFALAIPTMAADAYSITIDHPNASAPHTYEAYQIFSGVIDSTNSKLSEVEWGTGIDSAGLLADLMADAAWSAKVSSTTSAEALADMLAHKDTTTAMFETFRALAGENLTSVVAASDTDADANKQWVLGLPSAGYYLVKDKDGSLENELETYTNYILRVVGQDTLHPKGSSVTVKKDIIDGGAAKEASDYSIGDTVHFRVTGTLPTNYGTFSEFYYEIADTMSAGLTFTPGSVKVYLENHGEKLELTNPAAPAEPFFTVSSADAQHVNVVFADLKKITGRTIDASTIIIMEYDAVLNAAAEIGQPGNRNDAKIIFDNNPYAEGRGETPDDYAWAFTWELDTNKTDDLGNSLANAKFVFYRESEGAKQYVILDADNKVAGWTADKSLATVIVSEEGVPMPIIGLEADTYYLEETEAPDGYNLLDAPVTVIITAETGGPDGAGGYTVKTLNVKFGSGDITDGNKDTGIVEGTVVNKSGTVLPETGGIGTTMFYIFGGLMFVGAAVLLVTKKRMSY